MKSKVVKLEQWAKSSPDDYGNLPYNVEFEDGVSGVYRGNPTKGLAFKVGEEAEYEKEDTTAKSGKAYVKITKPKKDFKGAGISEETLFGVLAKSNTSLLVAQKVITEEQAPQAYLKLLKIAKSL